MSKKVFFKLIAKYLWCYTQLLKKCIVALPQSSCILLTFWNILQVKCDAEHFVYILQAKCTRCKNLFLHQIHFCQQNVYKYIFAQQNVQQNIYTHGPADNCAERQWLTILRRKMQHHLCRRHHWPTAIVSLWPLAIIAVGHACSARLWLCHHDICVFCIAKWYTLLYFILNVTK